MGTQLSHREPGNRSIGLSLFPQSLVLNGESSVRVAIGSSLAHHSNWDLSFFSLQCPGARNAGFFLVSVVSFVLFFLSPFPFFFFFFFLLISNYPSGVNFCGVCVLSGQFTLSFKFTATPKH